MRCALLMFSYDSPFFPITTHVSLIPPLICSSNNLNRACSNFSLMFSVINSTFFRVNSSVKYRRCSCSSSDAASCFSSVSNSLIRLFARSPSSNCDNLPRSIVCSLLNDDICSFIFCLHLSDALLDYHPSSIDCVSIFPKLLYHFPLVGVKDRFHFVYVVHRHPLFPCLTVSISVKYFFLLCFNISFTCNKISIK